MQYIELLSTLELVTEKQQSTNLYQFFKLLAIGFTIVSFFISIAVIGYIWVSIKNQQNNQVQKSTSSPAISLSPAPTLNK